ncbi:cytochrome c-type biogenesis protein CcmH [Micromonospora sp. NPDC051296]|uniref:cytochrome c-type biogenesis protein CcmH n=1 Tax=Micromonospora sp. NPDC051296 TaxID=3155046 RepID=UPI0034251759
MAGRPGGPAARGDVNGRRWLVTLTAAVLLALSVGGLARSVAPGPPSDPTQAVATELRCPACQGESVADSSSPIAVSMRQVITDQLAEGRSPAEIRRWFVQRYGDEVLAQPPLHGASLLLWVVPAVVLLGVGAAALRTLRPRQRRVKQWASTTDAAPTGGRRARRAWWLAAAGLVALVSTVAVAAGQLARPVAGGPAADPAVVAVQLAHDLEGQQRYAAAAEMYREALRDRPDDAIRLRLAFALLRAGDAAAAERTAREVLDRVPDSPDGLLVAGLAQRLTRPEEAPATLRRFLSVAPNHPAGPEVSRLLGAA